MSDPFVKAGHYELISFRITSYDKTKTFELKNIIHSFEIHESMKRGSIRGFAKMFDSVGLLQNFPLRGEEFIEIHYKDFYGVEQIDKMFLYSITDTKQPVPTNPSRWEYTIHFVSRPKIFSESARIRKAFAGPPENREQGDLISEFVKNIYDNYYGQAILEDFHNDPYNAGFTGPKSLEIQETDGRQRIVVPNYTPEQTMFFFARRAYSASSFSQTYRFFENRKNYVFATNEYVQNTIYNGSYTFTQNFYTNVSEDNQLQLQESIISIDYGEVVNTIDDINNGGYRRSTFEMDTMYNIINKIDYDYGADFETNNPNQTLYHTPEFIEERFTKEDHRWVVKDYSSEGMPEGRGIRFNTHYPDIYNKKGAYFYHNNRNKTVVTIHGNNMIIAGSSVDISLLKHVADTDPKIDIERSGLYLVESVENVFYEDTYLQKLTLVRNGIGNAA